MKIFQIATGYTSIPAKTSAATEIVIEHLSNSLVELGNNVTVVDIFTNKRERQKFKIIDVKMPKGLGASDYTHDLGLKHKMKRMVYSLGVWKKLKQIEKELIPDIIHVHNQYNGFFIPTLYFGTKIPTVYTLHSHIWTRPWNEIKDKIRINYCLETRCFKKFDKIIVLNEYAKANLVEKLGISFRKIEVLGNGVDTSIYRNMTVNEFDRMQFRSQYANEKEVILLFVGSFEDRKNQMFILQSLKKIDFIKPVKLLFIGQIVDNEYYQKLNRYVEENDLSEKVHFVGEVSPGIALNKYYNIADIFVFPSKAEAFGLVLLEAMSVGIPVLSSDIPSSKLLSKREGDIIMYVGDNENDFFQKVQKLLTNEGWRRDTAKLGHSTVLDHYDWKIIALKHVLLYEKLKYENTAH